LALLLVPVPVVVEWWCARSDVRERIPDAVSVEPLSLADARAAGEALAKLRIKPGEKSLAIDVIVVAFAATHGGLFLPMTSRISSGSRQHISHQCAYSALGARSDSA
jgi:hypothetical protein